jgi:DNA topoisomerase-1
MNLVNSQQARRLLDRLVGYKLSPLLWKKVRIGLSAGRVQSVSVMIICDREKEIENFVPVEYWTIEVELSKFEKKIIPFKARFFSMNRNIKSKEQSDKILEELKNAKYIVKSISTKQRIRSPYPPYTTSTMQQDASKRLRFSASKTMTIAQKLYEGVNINEIPDGGLITYMRTDSLNIAKSIQNETLKFIEYSYGNDFIPKISRIYKTTTKGAQEAHEAIRPTSLKTIPSQIKQYLSNDEFKLYSLIWRRFLASQMSDAIYNTVIIEISANDYLFKAIGSTLVFDGFIKIYKDVDDNKQKINLPQLSEQENLNFLRIIPQQHFTEPPPRYTEASLIKILEEHGIGRPSTYAPIIRTILDRLYVRLDGRKFIPTNLGIIVNNVLKNYFRDIINVKFTAEIEKKLDEISENKIMWQSILKKFYEPFEKVLDKAEKNLQKQKIQAQKTSEICPSCGKFMVIRDSRIGQFLGCSGYPECKTTLSLDKYGKITTELLETNMRCDKCGNLLIKKIGFKGKYYLSCKNYPNCKTTYNIDSDGSKLTKSEPECTNIKCEKCGSEMLKRTGKKRSFLTCSSFPKCRNLQWINTTKFLKKKIENK